MTETRQCLECGAVIDPEAVGGHCPSCLLRIGLAVADGGVGGALPNLLSSSEPLESPSPLNPELSTKTRYIGEYELIKEIAHGGMGVVYEARQASLNRIVALKLIRAGELATEAEIARFRREAEVAAHLDHPNIVPIYEVGEHEGRHYFSMKRIEGGALSERTTDRTSEISNLDAARLLATVARAVHYAHQRGLLHRDLKPGNILLDRAGQPHITDFGLAKRIETDSSMTVSGAILGTPSYIAPEQAAGAKQLTTAVDVYSLGAILYELLAGRPPFAGATVMETLQKVMNEEPVAPSGARGSRREEAPIKAGVRNQRTLTLAAGNKVDRDLETICLMCLEKDPARRYGTAEALAEDLERWLEHRPIRARPVTTVERVGKWMRRKPALAAAVVALHLAVAAGLAGILWQWRSAVTAQRATREELWRSQLLDARSERVIGGPGRRTKALEILKRAAAYRPSVALRNEALATLVLPDLGSNVWWRSDGVPFALTGDLSHSAGVAEDGRIAVWRGATPQPVAQFAVVGREAKSMRFSPDDALLAVEFADGAIGVWRWQDQQLLLRVQSFPSDSTQTAFDFTADGREFWFSDAKEQLARCSLPDGQPLPASAIAGRARRLRFDPTGRRLAGWAGRTVTVWDVTTGDQLGEWQAPRDIWSLAWHPGGDRFALGAFQAGVHIAEIGQTNLVALAADADPNPVFTRVGFTPDGTFVLAGGWGNIFAMWNFATRQQELRSRSTWFQQISRDGAQVAVGVDGQGHGVRTLHLPVGVRRLRVPTVPGAQAESAAWHPGGRWLVTGHPSGWVIWDTTTGQPVRQYNGTTPIRSVQFLPDGNAFLTGGGAGARLWPCEVGHVIPRVGAPRLLTSSEANERAALSPDGKRFAAVGDYSWLGPTSGERAPVRIADGDVNTFVSFSPDGRWLCISRWQGTHLKIRDAFTGAFVTNLPASTAGFGFTPAGDQLVSVRPDRVTFWQAGTWKRGRELPFGDDWKHSDISAYWPDGSCVLTTGRETMLQLWDLEANAEIATFWLPVESSAWGAIFDPAGRRMAMTGGRPWVDLWDFAALRQGLALLGLDWPDERPGNGFVGEKAR